MTDRTIRIHPVRLDLVQPLTTGAGVIDKRDVLLVQVIEPDGTTGWGEAAPLPGWPGPGLAEVRSQLDAWQRDGQVPSAGPARAAVEMAGLDIEARRAGVSVARLLASNAPGSIAVNALLDAGEPAELAATASAAIDEGFDVLKVKVGASANDVDRVRAVRSAAPAANIRLDANRAWSPDHAVAFCAAVEPFGIEFLEEPVSGGVDALVDLQRRVGIDLAADESLAEVPVDRLAEVDLPVLVVKPSALGGYRPLLTLGQSRRVVVTSFLDSAIGVAAAVHLAAALHATNPSQPASGLATSSRFASDVAVPGTLVGGTLALAAGDGLGLTPKLD